MPKREPKTLKQLSSFLDVIHQDTKRDEIMVWLDQNIVELVQKIFDTSWNIDQAREQFDYFISGFNGKLPDDLIMPPLPPRPLTHILKKEWEYVLKNNKGDPVGFIDILVQAEIPHLQFSGFPKPEYWSWNVYSFPQSIGFRVMSRIDSISDLITQIKLSKVYLDVPLYIVSSDDRFKNLLQEQNIGFIKFRE